MKTTKIGLAIALLLSLSACASADGTAYEFDDTAAVGDENVGTVDETLRKDLFATCGTTCQSQDGLQSCCCGENMRCVSRTNECLCEDATSHLGTTGTATTSAAGSTISGSVTVNTFQP